MDLPWARDSSDKSLAILNRPLRDDSTSDFLGKASSQQPKQTRGTELGLITRCLNSCGHTLKSDVPLFWGFAHVPSLLASPYTFWPPEGESS